MDKPKVSVQVFKCKQGTGYLVRLTVMEGDQERISRYPCPTFEEAEALSASIKNYMELGLPLEVLLPEDNES